MKNFFVRLQNLLNRLDDIDHTHQNLIDKTIEFISTDVRVIITNAGSWKFFRMMNYTYEEKLKSSDFDINVFIDLSLSNKLDLRNLDPEIPVVYGIFYKTTRDFRDSIFSIRPRKVTFKNIETGKVVILNVRQSSVDRLFQLVAAYEKRYISSLL